MEPVVVIIDEDDWLGVGKRREKAARADRLQPIVEGLPDRQRQRAGVGKPGRAHRLPGGCGGGKGMNSRGGKQVLLIVQVQIGVRRERDREAGCEIIAGRRRGRLRSVAENLQAIVVINHIPKVVDQGELAGPEKRARPPRSLRPIQELHRR